jgi:hypothetical protein
MVDPLSVGRQLAAVDDDRARIRVLDLGAVVRGVGGLLGVGVFLVVSERAARERRLRGPQGQEREERAANGPAAEGPRTTEQLHERHDESFWLSQPRTTACWTF